MPAPRRPVLPLRVFLGRQLDWLAAHAAAGEFSGEVARLARRALPGGGSRSAPRDADRRVRRAGLPGVADRGRKPAAGAVARGDPLRPRLRASPAGPRVAPAQPSARRRGIRRGRSLPPVRRRGGRTSAVGDRGRHRPPSGACRPAARVPPRERGQLAPPQSARTYLLPRRGRHGDAQQARYRHGWWVNPGVNRCRTPLSYGLHTGSCHDSGPTGGPPPRRGWEHDVRGRLPQGAAPGCEPRPLAVPIACHSLADLHRRRSGEVETPPEFCWAACQGRSGYGSFSHRRIHRPRGPDRPWQSHVPIGRKASERCRPCPASGLPTG